MIGTTLSHYRITEKIGEGGMGEVYRARDERLDRDVAIKVLPEEMARSPKRMERFEREAKLLAQLNHPNIATLYGLEEDDGRRFIVMELVEGEDLDRRVKRGAIPVDEALGITLQIAEGLEAAHEHGIIHRDLKPANVMITTEGRVKVLDFGLAKARHPLDSDTETQLPTVTGDMTAEGVILGTASYMSPEQARGKAVDKRTDIWAYGCLFWEMLTGKKLFTGESQSDVLAAVLGTEVNLSHLPADVPSKVRLMIGRCLEKDPRRRLRDIGEARIGLDKVDREDELVEGRAATQSAQLRNLRWRWSAVAFVAGAVLTALALLAVIQLPEPAPRAVRRFSINLPPDAPIRPSNPSRPQSPLALSPDGKLLVYVARTQPPRRLMMRRLDHLETKPIPGAETTNLFGFGAPFFSPDGRRVGFADNPYLKTVDLAGGTVKTVCQAPEGTVAAWRNDGKIVFASILPAGIFIVPGTGGSPQILSLPDQNLGETLRRFPEPLPGGRGMLLTVEYGEGLANKRLAVLDLQTDDLSVLADRVEFGRYAATGHIIYPQQGRLMAMPFDVDTLTATGDSADVTESGMGIEGREPLEWAFSNEGTLVYAPVRSDRNRDRELVWVDQNGNHSTVGIPPPSFNAWARLSPDGRKVATSRYDLETGEIDLWLHDLETGGNTRVTFSGSDMHPVWSPDGERIVFGSGRAGPQNLFMIDAHGGGNVERLTESDFKQWPYTWSADGKVLFYVEDGHPETLRDLWTLSFEEDPPRAAPLLRSRHTTWQPAISPDGKWLAYCTEETGTDQVVVQPYPAMDRKWPVSVRGGRTPWWHPRGDTIFFSGPDGRLMEARLRTHPKFVVERPMVVLDVRWGVSPNIQMDLTPDGERFLLLKTPPEEGITELIVVQNWFEELKRKAPPN